MMVVYSHMVLYSEGESTTLSSVENIKTRPSPKRLEISRNLHTRPDTKYFAPNLPIFHCFIIVITLDFIYISMHMRCLLGKLNLKLKGCVLCFCA